MYDPLNYVEDGPSDMWDNLDPRLTGFSPAAGTSFAPPNTFSGGVAGRPPYAQHPFGAQGKYVMLEISFFC